MTWTASSTSDRFHDLPVKRDEVGVAIGGGHGHLFSVKIGSNHGTFGIGTGGLNDSNWTDEWRF